MPKDWGDVKRVEVVTTYLALGKAPLVEAVTGVPRATIRQWKIQPWWKELEHQIQAEDDLELSGKLKKVVDKSLDVVSERIQNGEFKLDSRTGKVVRIPVSVRDAHRVTVDLIDKYQLIRGKPTTRSEKVENADVLVKLAQQFMEWAKLAQPKEKVIEGEIINAVYEERETRLQERVSEVPGPSRDYQEAVREGDSSQGTDERGPRSQG